MEPARAPDQLPSFVHVVRSRAFEDPDQVAFTFVEDRDAAPARMTNAQLDRRARAIASELQRAEGRGERVLILLPPGLDYIAAFYGALYAGAIAVPAYPPGLASFSRSLSRTASIVRDARPRFVLTSGAVMAFRDRMIEDAPVLDAPRWIDVRTLPAGLEAEWKEPSLRRDGIAFLQYTSGSTGRPKGVMVSHRNLLHNTEQMRRLLRGGPGDRHCGWLPPYHDMGLVAGILMVSQFGMTVTLISPFAFIKHPYLWLKILSENRSTITGGAPFGFDLAARKVTCEQLATLDLSAIRVACIAAEPVRRRTLESFNDRFAPAGWKAEAFLPCYGLAESTLMATGGAAEARPVARSFSRKGLLSGRLEAASDERERCFDLVANGFAIPGMDAVVVEPSTRRLQAESALGEIWIRGESVALGYWEKPEENEEVFGARLSEPGMAERCDGPFLRTGDVGAFVDGQLYVTGRMKDVVIADGVKHHAEDVEESIAEAHPALSMKSRAVFSFDDGLAERVVVVQEVVTRGLDAEHVASRVRSVVSEEHGIDLHAIVLIRARTMPKTPSAKIQRSECRKAYLEGNLHVIHEWLNPRAKRGTWRKARRRPESAEHARSID